MKVPSQDDSKKKAKELKEEITRVNLRMDKESLALQSSFEQEKIKMKQHYEQIYLKLYEENRKMKRALESRDTVRNEEKSS